MTKAEIIQRAKNLQALADPARNDNANERANAARQLKRWMKTHGLKMSDLKEPKPKVVKQPKPKKSEPVIREEINIGPAKVVLTVDADQVKKMFEEMLGVKL